MRSHYYGLHNITFHLDDVRREYRHVNGPAKLHLDRRERFPRMRTIATQARVWFNAMRVAAGEPRSRERVLLPDATTQPADTTVM